MSGRSPQVSVEHDIRKRRGKPVADAIFSLRWKARRATANFRALPDFMIIGMMRCGSGTVYRMLSEHHQVLPAFRKEIRYFDRNYDESVAWYRGHFPPSLRVDGGRMTGDGSPTYLAGPGVEHRVRETLGEDLKFIVLLRNPVVRAQSQWRVMTLRNAERLPFRDALAEEDPQIATALDLPHVPSERRAVSTGLSYIRTGEYADHLERWFEVFPRESFWMIRSEDLFTEPAIEFVKLCRFLGLDQPKDLATPHIGASIGPIMEPEVRSALTNRFREPNKRLVELIGPELRWPDTDT